VIGRLAAESTARGAVVAVDGIVSAIDDPQVTDVGGVKRDARLSIGASNPASDRRFKTGQRVLS
jgi:hypothetical protein